ncbi:MAG: type VI secretion system baseplate subunit TssK [Gemmatimonadaceae bacterium]|nr:type VI secretion system baseplate subunit TssK [Gemmatimonadaceae bacterium]
MRQLQPVLWSKGLLLDPHHLQAQDRYVESLLAFHADALGTFPVGLSAFALDHDRLARGTVAVRRLRGILADGTIVDAAVGEDGRGQARFRLAVADRADETRGGSPREIPVATLQLRLLTEEESHAGYVTMPIARVARREDGALHLDPAFEPPLLRLEASLALRARLAGLRERLAARAAELAQGRRARARGLADFAVTDVAAFWLLHTLNGALPVLSHHVDSGMTHPASCHALLATLAGALQTFAPADALESPPVYEHASAGPGFAALVAMIDRLANTAVPTRAVSLPLHLTRPNVHATTIHDERVLADAELYLAVASRARQAELPRRVPQLVKVAASDTMDRLIRLALPGLTLSHVAEPPDALPIRLDYHYFRLDKGGASWETIRAARDMAVYVPSEVEEPRLELVALLP